MAEKSFFQQVHALVARIPAGKIMTYGQIAQALGGVYSPKLVGFAMSAAPDGGNLPCHRVVNRLGEMAPGFAFGGQERQRSLLESEGAPFLPDGRVDVGLARFEPGSRLLAEIMGQD